MNFDLDLNKLPVTSRVYTGGRYLRLCQWALIGTGFLLNQQDYILKAGKSLHPIPEIFKAIQTFREAASSLLISIPVSVATIQSQIS